MRTLVDIPDDQIAELTTVAAREKVSRAALIRQAIADLLATKRPKRGDALAASFGLWSDMEEDSLAYEERLRREWDREWE